MQRVILVRPLPDIKSDKPQEFIVAELRNILHPSKGSLLSEGDLEALDERGIEYYIVD